MIPLKAWAALVAVVLLIGTHYGAYGFGKHVAAGEQAQAQLDAEHDQQGRSAAASTTDAADQAAIDAAEHVGQQEALTYALTDAGRAPCFDADGLRLFNGDPPEVRSPPAATRAAPPRSPDRPEPGGRHRQPPGR